MHYQCSLAAAAGSRCTGARSGVVTERGSRGIGASQKVTGPPMGVKHKESSVDRTIALGPKKLDGKTDLGRYSLVSQSSHKPACKACHRTSRHCNSRRDPRRELAPPQGALRPTAKPEGRIDFRDKNTAQGNLLLRSRDRGAVGQKL